MLNEKIEKLVNTLTLEEKAQILTGSGGMLTANLEKHGILPKRMADGPHGVRTMDTEECVHFPNLCSLAASWDKETAENMGKALAYECAEVGRDMLLGPGNNIKRTPLCGRNFEYFSEDPVLAGEMAASYIKGMENNGRGACLKHYAANNQEIFRQETSVDVDERTLREIYLKAFEIAVKKGKPSAVMCAYNKINSVWCAENPFILTEVLKKEWGYEGFVVSDWGAVQDSVKSIAAGLDLEMPCKDNMVAQITDGYKNGKISMERIDDAVRRILRFVLKDSVMPAEKYSREKQHERAKEIAASGVVLLKNENQALPLTSQKYKKIAVIGEFADNPLISGQGSAEVNQRKEYTDSPLSELKKLLPDTEIEYREMFKKREYSDTMLWPTLYAKSYADFTSEADAVVIFVGAMESQDTEKLDKVSAELNPNYVMTIEFALEHNKNVIVVLQTGSAVILGDWHQKTAAVAEMWLGGESAGSAIAEVLCGKVNPSGKLPETFPIKLRTDMNYPGTRTMVEYNEKLDVGYRYYDKHPEEICYPFGHGLSYTKFEYSDLTTEKTADGFNVSFLLKNIGDCDGAEVVQLYLSDIVSTVVKPIKELKKFEKIFLKAGEEKRVHLELEKSDFEYFNTTLRMPIAEDGAYDVIVGSSSRDVRLTGRVFLNADTPYTMSKTSGDMIG